MSFCDFQFLNLLTRSPLCVEEMDISDKNFKPCPCGYQICQFCYNNIRQNPELNGRCPGCRRLYDDESVEYRTLTAEEYKMQQVKKEKREREKKQKEKEKKELELASKKHLAGLRVVQKNLVYVTGLNPPCAQEDLHSVLRSERYFGQYGKILKIVINRKSPMGHVPAALAQSIVVYVTFTRKEDASKCIEELDGSICDGRMLRAAHGTTKYCLSYLRGHPCPNPNCMFLHEPGEEADSYTRKDLSTHQGIKMGMSGAGNDSSENLAEYHFHEDDEEDRSNNLTTTALNSTPTVSHSAPVLPATAHWAKPLATSSSTADSPAVPNSTLANSAAFPTLGEIFKEQKPQKKDTKKSKNKAHKDGSLPDDVDIDDYTIRRYAEESMERLQALADSKQKLNVCLDGVTDKASSLPFFHFEPTNLTSYTSTIEDDKSLAVQIIENLLLRPMKNYHLAYSNQAVGQQQNLQQQAQQYQVGQPLPLTQTPVAQKMPLDQENEASQRQQQQQQLQQLQQQQQQMLLMLQQQLAQQNALLPPNMTAQQLGQMTQTPHFVSQLDALKKGERAKTSTPPPPGLFSKASENVVVPQGGQNTPLSSSQLLTQLMSGKK